MWDYMQESERQKRVEDRWTRQDQEHPNVGASEWQIGETEPKNPTL